jgi:hypothetical protein
MELSPSKLYLEVVNNRLNKNSAVDLLIALIEGSDNSDIRAESLEIVKKINLNNDKVYRLIENCFISDENSIIRCVAADILFNNLSKAKSFLPLKWASLNESSALVIKKLIDLFSSVDDPHFNIFKNNIVNRLKDIYDVPLSEINFFLNLEVIYAEYAKEINYKVGEAWHKIMNMLRRLPNSKEIIHRAYYFKFGGNEYKPLQDNSLEYLRKLIFQEINV